MPLGERLKKIVGALQQAGGQMVGAEPTGLDVVAAQGPIEGGRGFMANLGNVGSLFAKSRVANEELEEGRQTHAAQLEKMKSEAEYNRSHATAMEQFGNRAEGQLAESLAKADMMKATTPAKIKQMAAQNEAQLKQAEAAVRNSLTRAQASGDTALYQRALVDAQRRLNEIRASHEQNLHEYQMAMARNAASQTAIRAALAGPQGEMYHALANKATADAATRQFQAKAQALYQRGMLNEQALRRLQTFTGRELAIILNRMGQGKDIETAMDELDKFRGNQNLQRLLDPNQALPQWGPVQLNPSDFNLDQSEDLDINSIYPQRP